MKKTLLTMCLSLIAVLASAQTYFWQEDFSSYEASAIPEKGTYNYVCQEASTKTKIYKEALAGGSAPELLVSKKGGSFSATVALTTTGDFTLSFLCNKSSMAVTLSDGSTLGEVTNSGNNYTYPITVAEGTSSITITFTNSSSSNARLDNIKFYQGEAKKNAGLSWGTASREVTIGAEDNSFPTLTNGNNLDVTYSSSNTNVATISSDGTVTLVAAGSTTISATFEGNDTYEEQTVSYTLTVKGASTTDISNTPETAYTVSEAINLISAGDGLDTKVYVTGKIKSITEVSTSYGNATYVITDGTNDLTVFRGYYLNGEKFTSEDQIKIDDTVIVYGKLTSFQSTNEISTGSQIYSINVVTGINNITTETNTNAPAYNLAGQRVNSNAKGIVIRNGRKYINK